MMAIRGVLFDKDGTLMDVAGTWVPVYQDLLAQLYPGEDERRREMMATAGFDAATGNFRAGSVLAGGTTDQLVQMWWPELDPEGWREKRVHFERDYQHLTAKYLAPLMPLEPVLTALKAAGYRLGVATNDAEHSARNHMEALGVTRFFDAIIGWDSVANAKPAGDMIVRFADAAGLAPAEIAMVGDNPHDIEAARNGGAGLAIAVLTGNAGHDDIAHLADYTLASIADLPALLKGLKTNAL